jgi:hypothetical protein
VWDRAECNPVQWTIPATDQTWRKWQPSDPISPHWYDKARLARLIASNIAYAQGHGTPCRTVWDFVREFRGLSATVKAKAICEVAGASRMSLAQFYGDGEESRVAALLGAMRKQSRPIKPRDLGIIGEAHLRAKFESAGAAPESFSYKRSEIEHDGVPYLAEAAFRTRSMSGGSSPASTGPWPSAAIRSGVLATSGKALVRFSRSSAPALTSRSSPSCTWPVRASNIWIAANRA